MQARSLKPKHVEALVERWRAKALSPGTIKNRMAELRWRAEKIGKQGVIARDNDRYGIAERTYVTNESRARALSSGDLAKVSDPYSRLSLKLQLKELGGWKSRVMDRYAKFGTEHLAEAASRITVSRREENVVYLSRSGRGGKTKKRRAVA